MKYKSTTGEEIIEASDERQAAWAAAWKASEALNSVVLELEKWSWAPGVYTAKIVGGGEPRSFVFTVAQVA